MTNIDSILKSRDITLLTKVHLVKAMAFLVVMYGYGRWTLKKVECQRIDALNCGVGEDSWESLGLQGDQTSNLKGNQSWIFIGRTDTEAESPILWPLDVKNRLTGKDPGAGKDWRQDEKGTTGDEMVGWHHQLDGHESEQAPGAGDEQGSLGSCSPWSHNKLDMIKRLNWTELMLWRRNGNLFQCSYLENLTEEPDGLQSMRLQGSDTT